MFDSAPSSSLAVVILAAGKGSRMKSSLPKVMHKVAGRPMIQWIIETAEQLNPEKIIVVTAPGMDDVAAAVKPHSTAIQKEQNGTGDAVKPAMEQLKDFDGKVLILLGDEPFVDLETMQNMVNHDGLSVMAIEPPEAGSLGRMIVNKDGTLNRIVEFKDCDPAEAAVTLCNAGNFCIPARHLSRWLESLKNDNAQGEYYLTDVPKLAKAQGINTHVFETTSEIGWGVNTRTELAEHEMLAQYHLREQAMDNGTTLIDPETVYLSWDTQIGRDVIIEPNVVIGTGVTIGDHVTIYAFSHIEGAKIEENASIGPFARIRPKSVIETGASVGNFCEINRSTLKPKAKSKHVSYIGDAIIGENTNIGAGTIIANYDGFLKHQTIIGTDVFVGSNSTLISPITIGDGAIIAAGSNITKDTPDNALSIARSRQTNHEGWASEYRKVKSEQKLKKSA